MRGILNKGYPMPGGAMVERENGEVLSSISASYSPGTYRMKYLANTPEGMVEAYMYCTFN